MQGVCHKSVQTAETKELHGKTNRAHRWAFLVCVGYNCKHILFYVDLHDAELQRNQYPIKIVEQQTTETQTDSVQMQVKETQTQEGIQPSVFAYSQNCTIHLMCLWFIMQSTHKVRSSVSWYPLLWGSCATNYWFRWRDPLTARAWSAPQDPTRSCASRSSSGHWDSYLPQWTVSSARKLSTGYSCLPHDPCF